MPHEETGSFFYTVGIILSPAEAAEKLSESMDMGSADIYLY